MPAINHYTHKRFGRLYKTTLVVKTPVLITIFILHFLQIPWAALILFRWVFLYNDDLFKSFVQVIIIKYPYDFDLFIYLKNI